MPAVSVILVFHQDTRYLRPTIASILSQTYRDFELVLVDNGTGLSEEALGIASDEKRLRWVRLPTNQGISPGHNAGLRAARGDLIALTDSDDISLPNRLELQVEALRIHPEVGAVSGVAERIDADSRRLNYKEFCVEGRDQQLAYSQFAGVVATPATMVRASLLRTIPYLNEFPYCSDFDFQARLAEATWIKVLPEVLLQYRWYSAQSTQTHAASVQKSRCAIQLITARRRAGMPERLSEAARLVNLAEPEAAWRASMQLCLEEGHVLLGAYCARRLIAARKSLRNLCEASTYMPRLLLGASASSRSMAASMFLRGPVKALGIGDRKR